MRIALTYGLHQYHKNDPNPIREECSAGKSDTKGVDGRVGCAVQWVE